MGNKQSGDIYLKFDKPYYIAGETVSGHIYLNLSQAFLGKQVDLKIKGYEECAFGKNHRRHIRNLHKAHGNRVSNGLIVFFWHKIPIYQSIDNCIPAGQYCFPFSFLLGNQLPGTFKEEQQGYYAKICYKLKAECLPIIKDNQHLKYSQELVVREPIKTVIKSMLGQQIISPKTCCCCSHGQTRINCHMDRNQYTYGEETFILCQIDNLECTLPIKFITCKLKSTITLVQNIGERPFTQEKVYYTTQVQGVPANYLATDHTIVKIPVKITSNTHEMLQPSCSGQLIQCQHFFELCPIYEGCTCCSDIQIVKVPFIVLAIPAQNQQQIQAPQNWNPQIQKATLINFSDNHFYGEQNLFKSYIQQQPLQQNNYYPNMQNQQMIPQQQQQQPLLQDYQNVINLNQQFDNMGYNQNNNQNNNENNFNQAYNFEYPRESQQYK